MQEMVRAVLRAVYHTYVRTAHRRFYDLKARTRGMLSPMIYRRMYLLARALPDLDVIEIGGASGGGSIALALGLNESGKNARLIVVEKLQGGSRSRYGGYRDNLDIIQRNFGEFGVEERIVLFPYELTFDNGNDVLALVSTSRIAAFIHDADGRLDRDFLLFWPLLQPGGLIIIDDYSNTANYTPISDEHPQGGIKSVMTYRLLNQMIAWGLFNPFETMGHTVFGRKPHAANFTRFDLATCTRIIDGIKRERCEALGLSAERVTEHESRLGG
jgi:predicted O-methyltransferase YrrM